MRELFGRVCLSVLVLLPASRRLPLSSHCRRCRFRRSMCRSAPTSAKLIEELHYSLPRLDNSLSSAILDQYLDTLDGNRMYFTASDIASFNRLRYELDDRTRTGDLQPVFDIFNLFRKRAGERIDAAIALLATEPDYTLDESFQWDRSELPWPATDEEINEVWRKTVKSDGLRLMLTGKTWTEAAETLKDRYERSYRASLS